MYKWHANSAISRSRSDVQRCAEGIASSLRAFHVSVRRAEAADSSKSPSPYVRDPARQNVRMQNSVRRQAAAAGAAEAASLAPAPAKGIDARKLAAAPTGALRIRRTGTVTTQAGRGRGGMRGNFRGGATPGGGRGSFGTEGGFGAGTGRGGRGRGRGGERGDRPSGGRRNVQQQRRDGVDPREEAYLALEKSGSEWRREIEAGLTTPYEVLDADKSSKKGILASMAEFNLRPNMDPNLRFGVEGIHDYRPVTTSPLSAVMKPTTGKRARNLIKGAPRKSDAISWGIEKALNPETKGDTLGLVERYAAKNSGYLQSDGDSLAAKVKSLLPVLQAARGQGTTSKPKS